MLFMEAMMGEMKLYLEQIYERIDRMENTRVDQPQPAPNVRRRERVQPTHEVEDYEKFNGSRFPSNQTSILSLNSITDGVTDPMLFMEAMMGEMKLYLEQIYERIDRMENTRVDQPQPAPNVRRRERVQPTHEVEDYEKFNGSRFPSNQTCA
ncbi:hypothetical protein TIFTF001_055184 [Ficus carica]|uniref:Uncharacterized protein n=1 Tax=Ficus carica TaxID=3494 RepID=A0AA88JGW7_FICCA|nr:hypothetical protein TIFTF001_055184 [Ficus carica]